VHGEELKIEGSKKNLRTFFAHYGLRLPVLGNHVGSLKSWNGSHHQLDMTRHRDECVASEAEVARVEPDR
jgi:hypothetical protein